MKNISILVSLAVGVSCNFCQAAELQPSVDGDMYTFTGSGEYSGAISGTKTIVKTGSGTLVLKGLGTAFTGSIVIKEGVVEADAMDHFGNPKSIVVEKGGQLKTPNSSGGGLTSADVTFVGVGPDGSGALYVKSQNNKAYFKSTTMSGDATIRIETGNAAWTASVFGGTLDMQGHTLTIDGMGTWKMNMVTVKASDPQDGTRHARIKSSCNAYFQNNAAFVGTEDNVIENIGSTNMSVTFDASRTLIPWRFDGGETGGLNIAVANDPDASLGRQNGVAGPIVKMSASNQLRITNNKGGTSLHLNDIYAKTTIENRGNKDADGVPTVNTISGEVTALGGLGVMAGTLVMNGKGNHYLANSYVQDNWTAGATTWGAASLKILDAGTVTNAPRIRLYSSQAETPVELVISNTTGFVDGYITAKPNQNGVTVVDLQAGTELPKCALYMGVNGEDGTSAGVNAQNAVYVRGASIAPRTNGQAIYLSQDEESYGYFGMTDGLCSSFTFNFGAGAVSVGGPSVLYVKGGTLAMTGMSMSRGGRDSVFYQKGGTVSSVNNISALSPDGNSGAADGRSVMAFSGIGSTATFGKIRYYGRAAKSVMALNDGATLTVGQIERNSVAAGAGCDFFFAANGGIFDKVDGASSPFSDFKDRDDTKGESAFVLYDEGLTINVDSNRCVKGAPPVHAPCAFSVGFRNPTGKTILSIALPTDVEFAAEKYVGAPIVCISDATGKGAAAVAEFDEGSKTVTGITVVSPGENYSDSPMVTVFSADRKKTFVCAATVGMRTKDGGIIKTGDGELAFNNNCNNSYSGPTRILGGTMKFGLNAFPVNSSFEIAKGAVLDITGTGSGNRYFTTKSLAGSGTIIAGSTTAGVAGPRCLTVTDEIRLVAGETLLTDGEINWNEGVRLTIDRPELLNDDGSVNVLLQAKSGLGRKDYIDVSALPEKWRIVRRETMLGVRKGEGFVLILR